MNPKKTAVRAALLVVATTGLIGAGSGVAFAEEAAPQPAAPQPPTCVKITSPTFDGTVGAPGTNCLDLTLPAPAAAGSTTPATTCVEISGPGFAAEIGKVRETDQCRKISLPPAPLPGSGTTVPGAATPAGDAGTEKPAAATPVQNPGVPTPAGQGTSAQNTASQNTASQNTASQNTATQNSGS